MYYKFNPLDKKCKSVVGGLQTKNPVTFRVQTDVERLSLVLRKDGEEENRFIPMENKGGYAECTFNLKDAGLYWYYFSFGFKSYLGASDNLDAVYTETPRPYLLTVYEPFGTPDWLKGGLIYQIFPDRFFKSGETPEKEGSVLHADWSDCPIYLPDEHGEILNNDFFGGNFNGIAAKLPYLKSLGVTAIYLNPVFEAYSNHRYDTGDYMNFDPMLGTEDDFKNLIAVAEENGIKIILDGVFNHTGADSVYFNKYGRYPSVGAYQSKNSPFAGWYNFSDFPARYASWWGIATLPDVNENSASYVKFITGKGGVLEKYTKMGIGGWRLDVVDELPDAFVAKIRKAVKKANPYAVVIGEVWEDASDKISYGVRRKYFQGFELDGVMNYPLKEAIIDFVKNGNAARLSNIVKSQIDRYPKQCLDVCMNVLGTHDTVRILSALEAAPCTDDKKVLAEYRLYGKQLESAKKRLKAATLIQYTMPGVPSLYYGDEAGMQGYIDPLNRRCYPWGGEDEELLEWYKLLGKIRAIKDFNGGCYEEVYLDRSAIIYRRENALIAVNRGDREYTLTFVGALYDLLTGRRHDGEAVLLPFGQLLLYTEEV